MTCVLELRNGKNHQHLRAYLPESRVPFKGEQTLFFGGGQLKMVPNEVLAIDDVVKVFREYFISTQIPASIKWRDMSSTFGKI